MALKINNIENKFQMCFNEVSKKNCRIYLVKSYKTKKKQFLYEIFETKGSELESSLFLSITKHPNIIDYEFFSTEKHYAFITEYCNNKRLTNTIKRIEFLTENSKVFIKENYIILKDLIIKWILELKMLYLFLLSKNKIDLLLIERIWLKDDKIKLTTFDYDFRLEDYASSNISFKRCLEALSNLLISVQKCLEEVYFNSNEDSFSNFAHCEYLNIQLDMKPEQKKPKLVNSSEIFDDSIFKDCIVGTNIDNQKSVYKDIESDFYFINEHTKKEYILPKHVNFDLNTIDSIESQLFHKKIAIKQQPKYESVNIEENYVNDILDNFGIRKDCEYMFKKKTADNFISCLNSYFKNINNYLTSKEDDFKRIKLLERLKVEYYEKRLKLIHHSINAKNGYTELYDKKNLEKYQITNSSDLLLLFLPNFLLHTPFHFILLNNYLEILNSLTPAVEKYFDEFLNNKDYINKIIDLFIFILQDYSIYPLTAIEEQYCRLSMDLDYFDYNDDDDGGHFEFEDGEDDEDLLFKKNNRLNRSKIRNFLFQIKEKILNSEKFITQPYFAIC